MPSHMNARLTHSPGLHSNSVIKQSKSMLLELPVAGKEVVGKREVNRMDDLWRGNN